MAEAYGGADTLPKDFTSIRPNFIEQLKKGLDMDEAEEEVEEEEPEEPVSSTQVILSLNYMMEEIVCSFLASIVNWRISKSYSSES